MNIFVLDESPGLSAMYHRDDHCNKMLTESVQLLCTAIHLLSKSHGLVCPRGLWKKNHQNHPCAIWTRATCENMRWVVRLVEALGHEFHYRRIVRTGSAGIPHKSLAMLPTITAWLNANEEHLEHAPFDLRSMPQAMPEQYRVADDPVLAYRQYYEADKLLVNTSTGRTVLASWTGREPPQWLTPGALEDAAQRIPLRPVARLP